MKIVTNVADETGTAEVGSGPRSRPSSRPSSFDGKPFQHQINVNLIPPYGLDMERTLHLARLELARRYAWENKLNQITVPTPDAWLGILTSGQDLLRRAPGASSSSASTTPRCAATASASSRWACCSRWSRASCASSRRGLEEILVVEEKRSFLEMFAKDVLYGWPDRPRIVGKHDEEERPLVADRRRARLRPDRARHRPRARPQGAGSSRWRRASSTSTS